MDSSGAILSPLGVLGKTHNENIRYLRHASRLANYWNNRVVGPASGKDSAQFERNCREPARLAGLRRQAREQSLLQPFAN